MVEILYNEDWLALYVDGVLSWKGVMHARLTPLGLVQIVGACVDGEWPSARYCVEDAPPETINEDEE